jgi:predicted peptidase
MPLATEIRCADRHCRPGILDGARRKRQRFGSAAVSYLVDRDPFAALAKQIKSIPTWLFHGDADESVPVEQSRRMAAALQKVGTFVRYTEYYRGIHQETPNRAFADMDMVTWLWQQHR